MILAFEVECTADKPAGTGHTVDTAVHKGHIQGTAAGSTVSIAAGTNAQLSRPGEQTLMHLQWKGALLPWLQRLHWLTLLLPLMKLSQLWWQLPMTLL
jgi:hypothetical protein